MDQAVEKLNLPNLKQNIEAIKDALRGRKKNVATRTLIMSLPAILFIPFAFSAMGSRSTQMMVSMTCILPFVLLYTFLLHHLFFIEQNIWVSSFLSGKSIDTKTSLSMAKKAFVPSLFLKIQIFFRYYLWGVVAGGIPLYFVVYLMFQELSAGFSMDSQYHLSQATIVGLILAFIFIPLVLWVYFYFLKIKFRYFWFIFLERHNSKEIILKDILTEMKDLNNYAKTDAFKRSLAINLGADIAQGFGGGAVSSVTGTLGRLGGEKTQIAALAAKLYGTELSSQFVNIARITSTYLLYNAIKEDIVTLK